MINPEFNLGRRKMLIHTKKSVNQHFPAFFSVQHNGLKEQHTQRLISGCVMFYRLIFGLRYDESRRRLPDQKDRRNLHPSLIRGSHYDNFQK